MSVTSITWGITLVLMLRSVGAVIFGMLSDRFGRKWPFITNCVLFIVLELGTGFVQTYKQFLAVRALFGIAMGVSTAWQQLQPSKTAQYRPEESFRDCYRKAMHSDTCCVSCSPEPLPILLLLGGALFSGSVRVLLFSSSSSDYVFLKPTPIFFLKRTQQRPKVLKRTSGEASR